MNGYRRFWAPGAPVMRVLRKGWQDESGAIIVLSLFSFVVMILVAGLAIDFAHFEERRTRMQATLDRAVLAAADIQQTLQPVDVVEDYFARAGLADSPVSVNVENGLNFREVNARTRVTVPTMFVNLVGVPNFSSPAGSGAEERIGDVEISLVLDVSGSMSNIGAGATRSKIDLLKTAANEFVDTMFETIQPPGVPPGKLSMSIVPYNQQVALGADLGNDFTFTNEHNSSHCVDFTAADFTRTGISDTQVLRRTSVADMRNTTIRLLECQQAPSRDVIALSNSAGLLKAKIGQLVADGDTAIDIGMKWGVALIDPQLRGLVNKRANNGKVSNELRGRPFDYGREDALKVVVLMTDGENTNTHSLKDGFRSGPSDLVRGRDNVLYYHNPARSGEADFCRSGCSTSSTATNRFRTLAEIGGSFTRLTYQEVWQQLSLNGYATNFVAFGRATRNSSTDRRAIAEQFVAQARESSGPSEKNINLAAVCNAAKQEGTVVFAIGFEAPAAGRSVLRSCATGDAYYYDAAGTTISDAFAGIASAINALRLTQ